MKKIISFSLFGDHPRYQRGALGNLYQSRDIYPGWICRFYVSEEIPEVIVDQLRAGGAEIVLKTRKSLIDGMFWRFLPASERDLEAVIVRDADSQLGEREALAVQQWLASEKRFHIMRDHPFHVSLILGVCGERKAAFCLIWGQV
jgi:hypothetical protein